MGWACAPPLELVQRAGDAWPGALDWRLDRWSLGAALRRDYRKQLRAASLRVRRESEKKAAATATGKRVSDRNRITRS
jgi:hypothetical protein